MKILKYIFLLLLLSLISFSVFIATQKGNFSIEKSKIIHSSKSNVFNYVNDAENWQDFMNHISEEKIDESIWFALMCHQRLVDLEAEYTTPNEQLSKENDHLVIDNKTLTYNIEVQTMLLMAIKRKIWIETYDMLKAEVLESAEFKKLKSRNWLWEKA